MKKIKIFDQDMTHAHHLRNSRTTLKLGQRNVGGCMVFNQRFYIEKFSHKSVQKIRFENIQNRRPYGYSIKHDGFWYFFMCKASADDQSPNIHSKIHESWITLSDTCKNHDFEVQSQSIRVEGGPIIRRPNLRTSYPMDGSSQPLVFR